MKKHKFTAAALTLALSAAMALPVWAASLDEAFIVQIEEPLDTETSEDLKPAENDAPQPEKITTEASEGEQQTEDVSEQDAAELSDSQKKIITQLVPDDLYRFYTSRLWEASPETSASIASLSAQDMVNEIYGVLRNAGRDSVIFTPVEHEAVEGYSVWFDKDDALAKLASLYGRTVDENDIAEYNSDWGGDMPDMIAIDGNAIASMNPEGEGKVRPSIDSAVKDGDELRVYLTFTATFDDSRNNGSGRATAVFTADPENILGYRLKSISLD